MSISKLFSVVTTASVLLSAAPSFAAPEVVCADSNVNGGENFAAVVQNLNSQIKQKTKLTPHAKVSAPTVALDAQESRRDLATQRVVCVTITYED